MFHVITRVVLGEGVPNDRGPGLRPHWGLPGRETAGHCQFQGANSEDTDSNSLSRIFKESETIDRTRTNVLPISGALGVEDVENVRENRFCRQLRLHKE